MISKSINSSSKNNFINNFWMERSVMIIADNSTYSSGVYIWDGYLLTVEHGVNLEDQINVVFYLNSNMKKKLNLKQERIFLIIFEAFVVYQDSDFDFAILKLKKNEFILKEKKAEYEEFKVKSKKKYKKKVKSFINILDNDSYFKRHLYLNKKEDDKVSILGFPEFKMKDFNNCCVSHGNIMKTISIENDPTLDGKSFNQKHFI
jgi:hypothetical protein